jgi:CMP/dCMP kinase
VQSDLQARDKSDSERPVAPLTMAADAVYIDTTGMEIERVVERVMGIVRGKLEERGGNEELRAKN